MNQVVDARVGRKAFGKALVAHPGIIVNFAQVAAAAIGQQHHDQFIFGQVLGDFQRAIEGRTAGTADQQTFLADRPPGHQEGVAVADRHPLVNQAQVNRTGDEVFADTLDFVGPDLIAGIERAFGVNADNPDFWVFLFEIFGNAADSAACADTRHEVINLSGGLLPDFGAGGFIVGTRIGRVKILVGLEAAGNFFG